MYYTLTEKNYIIYRLKKTQFQNKTENQTVKFFHQVL